MDWQLALTFVVIALAGGYLALRGWRTWRGTKGNCSGGCGCAKSETKPTPTIIEAEKLVLRQRPKDD
jgi:hypothetical protein